MTRIGSARPWLACVLVLGIGCDPPPATDAGATEDAAASSDGGRDLDAAPAPTEIGPDGGRVVSDDGRLVLDVPAGALSMPTAITLRRIDASALAHDADTTYHARAYDMQPDGLTFAIAATATLTLDADEVSEAGDLIGFAAVSLWNVSGAVDRIDTRTEWDDASTVRAIGAIEHFSSLGSSLGPVTVEPRLARTVSMAGAAGTVIARSTALGPTFSPATFEVFDALDRTNLSDVRFRSDAASVPSRPSAVVELTCVAEGAASFRVRARGGTSSGGAMLVPYDVTAPADTTCSRAVTGVDLGLGNDATRSRAQSDALFAIEGGFVRRVDAAGTELSRTALPTTGTVTHAAGFATSAGDGVFLRFEGGALYSGVPDGGGGLTFQPYVLGREVSAVATVQTNASMIVAIADGETRALFLDATRAFTYGETHLDPAQYGGEITALDFTFTAQPATCPPTEFCKARGHGTAFLGGANGRLDAISTIGDSATVSTITAPILGVRATAEGSFYVVTADALFTYEHGTDAATLVPVGEVPRGHRRMIVAPNGELIEAEFHTFLPRPSDPSPTFDGLDFTVRVPDGTAELVVAQPLPAGCVGTSALQLGSGVAVQCSDGTLRVQAPPERPAPMPTCTPELGTAIIPAAGGTFEGTATPDRANEYTIAAAPEARRYRGRAFSPTATFAFETVLLPSPRPELDLEVGPGATGSFRFVALDLASARRATHCAPYTLTVTPTTVVDEAGEPNDSILRALRTGPSFSGTLQSGDIDVYLVSVPDAACHIVWDPPGAARAVDFAVIPASSVPAGGGGPATQSYVLLGNTLGAGPVGYTVSCGEATGLDEDCHDGADDDGDGLADCDDPDCHWEPGCARFREVCGNALDDDADGLTDCADPDCTTTYAGCRGRSGETSCTDGLDDDGDGLTDCRDLSCAAVPGCERMPELCTNRLDDDHDGLTDCDDPDCSGEPTCAPGVESCTNMIDDDGDSAIDCDDTDCRAACFCDMGAGPPNGTAIARLGGVIGELGGAICLRDVCGSSLFDEPLWDRPGFTRGLGLGTPYGGDVLAPFVLPPASVPRDLPVRVRTISAGDMFSGGGGSVSCATTGFDRHVFDATLPPIPAGFVTPLVLYAGIRSSSSAVYTPANECEVGLASPCPASRQAAFHVYDTTCTASPGTAQVRFINLSPNQAAIDITQENPLVTPEADVVTSLAYGEATPYLSFATAPGDTLRRVWRFFGAGETTPFGTVNEQFDTTRGVGVMQAPGDGTCATMVVMTQRRASASEPDAMLVADAPLVCTGWRNVDGAMPVTPPCL